MDLIAAAAELDRIAMIRSYLKTRNLEELAAREPELAAQVEALCRAVLALRGPAMVAQAENSLRFSATALRPFVQMADEVKVDDQPPEIVFERKVQKRGRKPADVTGCVIFASNRNNWRVRIRVKGKPQSGGSYPTKEEAQAALDAFIAQVRGA